MIKKNILVICSVVIATVGLVLSVRAWYKVDRVVVVDVIKVFNEFKLKKELEAKVSIPLSKISSDMDSLNTLVEMAKQRGDSLRYEKISTDIYVLQEKAARAYEVSNKNINEQVWNRLNPLIDQFGKEQDYRVIIGANGMGSVLYKEDAVDITSKLIKFINEKYEKGQ